MQETLNVICEICLLWTYLNGSTLYVFVVSKLTSRNNKLLNDKFMKMKFYDLKRRKQISLFTANNGNSAKKVDENISEEVSNNHDTSANLICLLGATSNTSTAGAPKSMLKHINKSKNGGNIKGISSNIVNGNGLYGSSPPPPLSSLTNTDSLSSGRSSSTDSESGKK